MTGTNEELLERQRALLVEAQEVGALAALRAAVLEFEREQGAKDGRAREIPGRFGMIGASPAIERVFDLVARVAPSSVPVLVQGETGTGKELVARALHAESPRAKKPMIAENCAAIPANLLESELFGHVKGAFTGAVAERPGHFVAADGGTVFLDEIGDMPLEMQAKLLRVLEQGEVRPVGSDKLRKIDVRIVAATHRDLSARARNGEFREDLLYRLNVICVELPPLREREDDVMLLAEYFLGVAAREYDRARPRLSEAAASAFAKYAWPGNVRELENEIRRAVALGDDTIDAENLSDALNSASEAT